MLFIRLFFKRLGIYEYIKYSRPFNLYERLFKRAVVAAHKKEVRLYKSILSGCRLIFDVGAFDGHKTAAFLELCETVVAFEPDPANFDLLRKRFRHKKTRVILQPVALSDRAGESAFFIHHDGSAFNTLNPLWKDLLEADRQRRWNEEIRYAKGNEIVVRTDTLDAYIRQYGVPDFIKIDVEGHERRVLAGLRQKVPCISFECLLPEFRDDLLEILQKLMSLDDRTVFSVIYEEELIFPGFITHAELIEWTTSTTLYCFDVVARAGTN